MKRKHITTSVKVLSILVALCGISLPLIMKWKSGWGEKKLNNFEITEPEKVTKIIISNIFKENVVLTKNEKGDWLVNNSFKAQPDKINKLLKIMKDIRAKNPVSEGQRNSVIRDLAKGRKVEIFEGDDKIKTYVIGSTTQDELGNYMCMEGSDYPYVVHLPSFHGYISNNYDLNTDNWRDRSIFNAGFTDFKSMSIKYPANVNAGFVLEKNADKYILKNSEGKEVEGNEETKRTYHAGIVKASFEGFPNATQGYTDSINKTIPYAIISVTNTDGKTTELRVYLKSVTKETKGTREVLDNLGNTMLVDSDRYFAHISGMKELVIIQDFIFKNILLHVDDFKKSYSQESTITN